MADSSEKSGGQSPPQGLPEMPGMEWMTDLFRGAMSLQPPDLAGADKRYSEAMKSFIEHLSANPDAWSSAMADYSKRQTEMMASLLSPGAVPGENAAKQKSDRRFASDKWDANPFFSLLKNNYLLYSKLLLDLLESAPLDDEKKRLLSFVFNQYIDALSPANFPATNPEVIEATVNSGGANLAAGMRNLMDDMKRGMVSNTDRSAFALGENIATSPGKVIMQNRLVQLIEYAPQTGKVHEVPLLIYPPCINKFYILDIVPEKSLVNYLTREGFRVFMVSWVNAGAPEAQMEWDDYLIEGIMHPMDAVRDLTKKDKINVLGFCIGGTLLASALAVAAASGEHPARSITLLASMIDCHDTGDIGLFITEESVAEFDRRFAGGGLMPGVDLANTFAFLRPNDLVWPYVVKNYYMGEAPTAFDILYWNSDSVNLPGKMFAKYVRDTYLENNVAEGRSVMCGSEVDLGKIKIPAYAMAAQKDHIVPWRSAYRTACRLGGPVEFVLSTSGHIAGVVNPPDGSKRMYLSRKPAGAAKRAARMPEDPDRWSDSAKQSQGSWWPHWSDWLRRHSGKLVAAPAKPGNYKYKPLEDAPGSYVAAPLPQTKTSQQRTRK